MKLMIATAAAALIGTVAIADESTRYNDLRLDTSKTAEVEYSDEVREAPEDLSTRAADLRLDTSDNEPDVSTTFSSRSDITSVEEIYPYGGFGPGNDSR
ncbi:hypothetical protein ABMC89_07425 [Sulfitobacter sp. HNIBRBA3233]|uniref:hypothetical protein n=1 Tax=Sulfitobacter marinivivus TaxID=3158558 RepID=UPI0032DF43AC